MSGAFGRVALISALLLIWPAPAQVIFSHRVYLESGRSYYQLWFWNPADGALKALTHSHREHYNPVCGGDKITFTSPSWDQPDKVKLWSFNPATGAESVIGAAPEPAHPPDTRTPKCEQFAKRGALEACGNQETLVISRAGKQLGHFQIETDTCPADKQGTIGKCDTPIRSLEWTEDAQWLLVGEEGLNDNSTQRQNDYYLVKLATMKLAAVASAETAFWLPRRHRMVYLTPQDLAPLPGSRRPRSVWVRQLKLFDPETGKTTAITSGLSDNVNPAWCRPGGSTSVATRNR